MISTRYGRNVIMITSFDDPGEKKKLYRICANGQGPFCLQPTYRRGLWVNTMENDPLA